MRDEVIQRTTNQDIAELRRLAALGLSCADAARRTGMVYGTVRYWNLRARIGLRTNDRPRVTNRDQARLRAITADGDVTRGAAAHALGLHYGAVRWWGHRLGLTFPPSPVGHGRQPVPSEAVRRAELV